MVLGTVVATLFMGAAVAKADGTETCTPVYGGGTTCQHTPVNTGFEDSFVYGFGGVMYLGGLISFVDAKKIANKKITRVTVH